MAEEDNFDIDLYGDLDESAAPKKDDEPEATLFDAGKEEQADTSMKIDVSQDDTTLRGSTDGTISRTDTPTNTQQSLKRKEPSDDSASPSTRLHGTEALQISDLNWWTTDDDVRGWINQAGAEGELKELAFNEHKVNGKSKGAVFVSFESIAAASSVKDKIEQLNGDATAPRKIIVHFTNPHLNMFKTLPKDVPAKNASGGGFRGNAAGGGVAQNNFNQNQTQNGFGGGFRGRGNFNRGGNQGFQNRGGYNQGGYNNYNNNHMGNGGFQGNHMNQGFNNMRGGNMMGNNMRGGRGGNMMGMNHMNPMGMMGGGGGMGMGGRGGFGQMSGNFANPMMNHSFQGGGGGAGHFNPAFFGGQQQQQHHHQGHQQGGQGQAVGDWNNPHGAKRPRAE